MSDEEIHVAPRSSPSLVVARRRTSQLLVARRSCSLSSASPLSLFVALSRSRLFLMPSVILTRSSSDNARVAASLSHIRADIYSVPMIELREVSHSREELDGLTAQVRDSTVLITSAHAARGWLDLRQNDFADDSPSSYLVVGSASARMIEERDPTVPILAVATSAAALADLLPSGTSHVIYPCSSARRDEGVDWIRAHGVDIIELTLYEPVMPSDALERMTEALDASTPPRSIVFFSPSAVSNWFSLRSDIPADSIFVAIGPTTAESLRAHGVEGVITAAETDGAALADAVERSLRQGA